MQPDLDAKWQEVVDSEARDLEAVVFRRVEIGDFQPFVTVLKGSCRVANSRELSGFRITQPYVVVRI